MTEPLAAVWRDADAAAFGLRPLREHMTVLGRTIFEIWHSSAKASSTWHGVSEQLRIAASLEDVLAGEALASVDFCDFSGSDAAFRDMTRLWLAGTTVFALAWQAYELSVSVLKPGTTSAGADGVVLLGRTSGTDVPRLLELTNALLADVRGVLRSERSAEIDRKLAGKSPAQQGAVALAAFRNALIHAEIDVPLTGLGDEDDDSIAEDLKIRFFTDAVRLTMVLIQLLFADALGSDVEVEHDGQLATVGEIMRPLHMIPGPLKVDPTTGDAPTFRCHLFSSTLVNSAGRPG